MSLYLLHCLPDPEALATWATRHRLLSPDGDAGYAIHALLTTAFGEHAPKPFCYRGGRQGLLAYTSRPPEAFRENALLAPPDVDRALGLNSLSFKPFPTTWRIGQTLAFEVRARPILRAKDGRERDVFLHAIEVDPASEQPVNRESVYVEWLRRHLVAEGAAEMLEAGMDAFRLSRVIRRARADDTGKRQAGPLLGPDAGFKGQLRVTESAAFSRLVQRGIGRHRAFGFGMLLLKPARSC
jgi:CRISPR system Cascade subunit CasE